jgi:hypothetical protein
MVTMLKNLGRNDATLPVDLRSGAISCAAKGLMTLAST